MAHAEEKEMFEDEQRKSRLLRYTAKDNPVLGESRSWNYLRYFRLSPTQCAPNMFRVLGSIEALNERKNEVSQVPASPCPLVPFSS